MLAIVAPNGVGIPFPVQMIKLTEGDSRWVYLLD